MKKCSLVVISEKIFHPEARASLGKSYSYIPKNGRYFCRDLSPLKSPQSFIFSGQSLEYNLIEGESGVSILKRQWFCLKEKQFKLFNISQHLPVLTFSHSCHLLVDSCSATTLNQGNHFYIPKHMFWLIRCQNWEDIGVSILGIRYDIDVGEFWLGTAILNR